MDNAALIVFISAFTVAALAGVASLLRSNELITRKSVFNYILNSGFLGLAIALLWYNKYIEDVFFLVGLSIIAGLTGTKGVDLILGWAQKILGAYLKIDENKKEEPPKV